MNPTKTMGELRLSEVPVTKLWDVCGSPYRGITITYLVYMLRYIISLSWSDSLELWFLSGLSWWRVCC